MEGHSKKMVDAGTWEIKKPPGRKAEKGTYRKKDREEKEAEKRREQPTRMTPLRLNNAETGL